MKAVIRQTSIWMGLLVAGICQLQSEAAQNPRSVSRDPAAAIRPADAIGDINSVRASTESAATGATSPAEVGRTGNRSRIRLSLLTADVEKGITGYVEDKAAGSKITFESRRAGSSLTSRINSSEGFTLIEYIEAEQRPAAGPDGGPMQSEWVPWLRINGIDYQGYEGPMVDEMKVLAGSPDGRLVRYLAVNLVFLAPGHDLEQERRGLEVPYQALQRFFAESYKNAWAADAGRAELELAAHDNRPVEDFKLVPADCRLPNCQFVDTPDYQLTEQGGFVVKSLSPRLSLSHNYAFRESVSGRHHEVPTEGGGIGTLCDESQVDECFGRCGPGCGSWSHEWIESAVVDSYTYCFDTSQNGGGPALDCSQMCCSAEHEVYRVSGIALHVTSGHVTLGAIAHDDCCRSVWLGCANPVCYPAMLLAADCGIPFVGSDVTWSYVGPHTEGYEQATGVCCDPGFN